MALLLTSSYEVLSIDNCKLDRLDADQNSVDLELVIPFGNDKPNLAIKGIIAIGAMSAMSLAAGHLVDANKYSVCNNSSDTIQCV